MAGTGRFSAAPGRRHVPVFYVNIYTMHSYLLSDISHGPEPLLHPLGR